VRPSDKSGRHAPEKPPKKSQRKQRHEIEVKLRVADRRALFARLAELGAVCEGRVHEMNTLYDTHDRSLMRKGQLLRIRIERSADRPGTKPSGTSRNIDGALLTFKGPVRQASSSPSPKIRRDRYKVREERELRVADGDELAVILEALALRASFRYEKYRSTYRLPAVENVVIELDETPVGDFIEAEGARAAIKRAAELLGYRPEDYVTKSYWDLFQDSLRNSVRTKSSKSKRSPGLKTRDMLFSPRK
jgi:adenylate cyclase class 2